MPTERFYRLPEEKREVIRAAAIKEFARVPYEKASINQIIRNADISRGSFYTYFMDKQDVVEFLLEDQFCQMKQICGDVLEDTGGDYFAMMERLFDFLVEALQRDSSMIGIARNIFSYQENAQLLGLDKWPSPDHAGEPDSPSGWVCDKIDKSRFDYEQREEYVPLLTLASSSLLFALKQYYDYPEQLELIRKRYRDSLDIMKYGVYRKNNEKR